MKTKSLHNKILITAAILLCGAVLCCFAFSFGFDSSTNISHADTEIYASASAVWGGKDTQSLWQYGSDYLNVEGIKAVLSGWDKSRLNADKPIIIAIIDTGMDVNHEIFDGVLMKKDGKTVGYNAYAAATKDKPTAAELGNVSDVSTKHGTAVAGVAAMLIHEFGLENYVKIYPIKANSTEDGEDVPSFGIDAVIEALNWARTGVGADIINMSFSTTAKSDSANEWANSRELTAAVNLAAQNAALFAAAGNDASDSVSRVEYPAGFSAVVSVMSYNINGKIYSDSNYGDKYDIVAPGQDVYTAAGYTSAGTVKNSYNTYTGTSMASPAAAVTAALMKLRYRAEGKSDPSGGTLLRMFKNADGRKIDKNGYFLTALEPAKMLAQDFQNIPSYSVPTGIKITDDGKRTETDGAIQMRLDSVYEVTMIADLEPYAMTDPDLDGQIEWYAVYGDGSEKFLKKGKSIVYTPDRGGEFSVEARFGFDTSKNVASVDFEVLYRAYVAGDVRVTYKSEASSDAVDAAANGKLYTTETTVFSLTGLKYANPDVEIKWYVNGEYVCSGKEFSFKPSKTGNYVISAQYGENAPTPLVNSFSADVESFIARPLDIAALTLSCALVAGVIITLIIIRKKKKKAYAENAADNGEIDEKQR